jgi:hypothetical protein
MTKREEKGRAGGYSGMLHGNQNAKAQVSIFRLRIPGKASLSAHKKCMAVFF